MKLGFAAFMSGYTDRSDFTGIWNPHIPVFYSALPNLRDPENPKSTPMGFTSFYPTYNLPGAVRKLYLSLWDVSD